MSTERNRNIKMREKKSLERVVNQLKSLEDAFERAATARHKNISVRIALRIAQKCVNKQIGLEPLTGEIGSSESYYSCPQCAHGLCNIPGLIRYCQTCGQKIDWEEVENNGKTND